MWKYHVGCPVYGLAEEYRARLIQDADSNGYSFGLDIVGRDGAMTYFHVGVNGVSYVRGADKCAHCHKSFKGHKGAILKRFSR